MGLPLRGIGIAAAAILIAIGIIGYITTTEQEMRISDSSNGSPAAVVEDSTTTMIESTLDGDVEIGLITSLTGELSTHGNDIAEGAKLAVTDFNKHLEEMDQNWRLKLVTEDSQTNPVVALEKLTSLNAKGIRAVVGMETSASIRNTKGYSDANNMLVISCCSTAPELAIPNDSVYRLIPDSNSDGAATAKLMRVDGIEAVIPIWRGDPWGDGLEKATSVFFQEKGGVFIEGIRYNPDSPEFSASASLLAEKVSDAIDEYGADNVAVMTLGFSETLQLMQSASEHDVLDDVRWYGTNAIIKEHKLTNDPIGLKFVTSTNLITTQVAVSDNPIFQRAQKHFIDTIGKEPSSYAYSAYDSVWAVGLSMLEVQSTDISKIKEVFFDITNGHNGAIGKIQLNEAGDLANADYEIWGIRDGDWIKLGQYTHADDSVEFL